MAAKRPARRRHIETTAGKPDAAAPVASACDAGGTFAHCFTARRAYVNSVVANPACCASVDPSEALVARPVVFIYESDDKEPEELIPKRKRRWHAVAIVATATACAAARACKDNRYLSADAPRLPLEGCDAARCECRYGHFDDRRRGPRRAEEKGAAPPKPAAVEQRARRGRRKSDHAAD